MPLESLFPTHFLRDTYCDTEDWVELNEDLINACLKTGEDDEAGQAWCEEHGYDGYTSYASLNDLHQRATAFAQLKALLDETANAFAHMLHMDIGDSKLIMDSYWINILNPLAGHSSHIHPNSVLSGTYYVQVPEGAGRLKVEDPRLAFMMNAPKPTTKAPREEHRFVYQEPAAGTVMMWESWLRHEVTPNMGEDLRISISFNYSLD